MLSYLPVYRPGLAQAVSLHVCKGTFSVGKRLLNIAYTQSNSTEL